MRLTKTTSIRIWSTPLSLILLVLTEAFLPPNACQWSVKAFSNVPPSSFLKRSVCQRTSKIDDKHAGILFGAPTILKASPIQLANGNNDETNEELVTHRSSMPRLASLFAGGISSIAWVALAIVALRYHPDPKFSNCSMKHNILTMSQAFAFPLPVLCGASWTLFHHTSNDEQASDTRRRLCLGLAVTLFYSFAATAWAPVFTCGYDLYPPVLKAGASLMFAIGSALNLVAWKSGLESSGTDIGVCMKRIVQGTNEAIWSIAPNSKSQSRTKAALWASATVGFLWFTILPIVSAYPLMTIPTILGKRLSRPAGAFTFLGAVLAYCMKDAADKGSLDRSEHKTIGRVLGTASAMHLILVAPKLIGVDDGGILLPGRGLWEVYPAMMAVPFATTVSLLAHALVCFAAFS